VYSPEKNQDVHDLTAEAVRFAANAPEVLPVNNMREAPRVSQAAIERAQANVLDLQRGNQNTQNMLNQVTQASLLLAALRKKSNIPRGSV
jgi:hypothetical protein